MDFTVLVSCAVSTIHVILLNEEVSYWTPAQVCSAGLEV